MSVRRARVFRLKEMSGPVSIMEHSWLRNFPIYPDSRISPGIQADIGTTGFTKKEIKCPFVRLALYGKADSDQEGFEFSSVTRKGGTTSMSGTAQQAGYGEGRGVRVLVHWIVGILVVALVSQITSLAAVLPTDSRRGHLLQKNRHDKSTFTGTPGATFTYLLQPWGGVQVDDTERPFLAMWDVTILPLRSRATLLRTTEYRRAAESGTSMKRSDSPPSVQMLRLRNQNWRTTS